MSIVKLAKYFWRNYIRPTEEVEVIYFQGENEL